MKKKLFAIALAVLMIAILSFGTLAWFTDNDKATNVFEVGSVEIQQIEQQLDENGSLEAFENNKVLMPIVDVNNPAGDDNYQSKIVTVKSVGENPAYVRTHIAVPTALLPVLGLDYSDSANWEAFDYQGNQPVVQVDGIGYTVYSFTYKNAIGADQTQTETDKLLEGVYMLAHTDCQENGQGVKQYCYMENGTMVFCDFDITKPVNVLVATQAVQSEGFGSAAEAMTAAFADQHSIG